MMEMKEQRKERREERIAKIIVNMLNEHYPYEVISRLAETTTTNLIRIAKEAGFAYP